VRAAFAFVVALWPAVASAADLNDYPTVARADYIFACMKVSGESRDSLERCSCSIDVIATLLPYADYESGEAVLSLRQVPGRFGEEFRGPEQSRNAVAAVRRAQAEAEVRCF
jgi:hypothetical protein